MAVRDEIKEQTDKFKDMTADQKADYIYTYYKWWIIGAIALLIFTISVVRTVARNSKPTYISAMFLNTSSATSARGSSLESEFVEKYGIDASEYNLEFDYATYLDNDYGNQQSMAGQVKLLSRYETNGLDIICGPESVLEGSGDVGGYGNLEELLPDGMLDEMINKGYEPYYYTEKIYDESELPDVDGNRKYTDGETYIGGIYIDNCKKLVGTKSSCVYESNMPERMVLAIAVNSENIPHAIEFLEFVTE